MARSGGKKNSLKQPKEEVNIKYMHRPPTITPNYGNQRRSILPKSKVSRVLLYDNATQDHMLDIKLAHINIEKERISRIINLHKRSFSHRQSKKQQLMEKLSKSAVAKQNVVRPQKRPVSDRYPHRMTSISNGLNTMHLSTNNQDSEKQPLNDNNNNETTNDNNNDDTANVTTEQINETQDERVTETKTDVSENVKLPEIPDSKGRHVIFKVKDTKGQTKVYHTTLPKEDGMLNDLLPMHSYYRKLTDDPRFRSLQDLLVPLYYENDTDI